MLKQEPEDGLRSFADPRFRADVLAGLAARPRAIPARWFYDRRGSELFERITALPEYYPTRTEIGILQAIGPELARLTGAGRAVVEFGSGSSAKTPLVLAAVAPCAYVPIDISGDFLRQSAKALAAAHPGLPVLPVEADFLQPITLPREVRGAPKLGFFPGSTIGNMGPRQAVDLLRAMRASLGEGAQLLIGMDRVKDAATLLAAYDDADGVTAAFNLNLLGRINRELDGTVPLDAFRHEARWNDPAARIEMHLVATRDARFTVDERPFAIAAGETIHTENSHKYGPRDARVLRAGGWEPVTEWTDADGLFAVLLAEARPELAAPDAWNRALWEVGRARRNEERQVKHPGPCPKCGSAMAEGFVVDTTSGGAAASSWHPGAIVRSFWTGIKWSKKRVVPITAWRCNRCGFLEDYAVEQP